MSLHFESGTIASRFFAHDRYGPPHPAILMVPHDPSGNPVLRGAAYAAELKRLGWRRSRESAVLHQWEVRVVDSMLSLAEAGGTTIQCHNAKDPFWMGLARKTKRVTLIFNPNFTIYCNEREAICDPSALQIDAPFRRMN